MNKADKELARQAWTENDWEGHVDIPKLIQIVRADEREACAKVCEGLTGRSYEFDMGRLHSAAAIRARGQHDSL